MCAFRGDIKEIDVLQTLPRLPHLLNSVDIANLLHDDGTVDARSFGNAIHGGLGAENIDDGALQLLVVVAEGADILQACLQLAVFGSDLDRDELLIPAPSDFTSNVGKLLDVLIPCPENAIGLLHNPAEILIVELDQLRAGEQAVQHLI